MPVLFGYSLGKSQEILMALDQAGLPAMLHGAVHRMTEVYRELQPDFPHFERYDADKLAGKVLICPPSANQSRMLQKIKARRTAMLTGWALTPGAIHRYQTDACFPLSDHADYDDLIRYVELVKPQRVFTLHGYAAAFAADLRARGVEAWALSEENQMELTLSLGGLGDPSEPAPVSSAVLAAETPAAEEGDPTDLVRSFGKFSQVGDAIASITGKLKKIEILSEYFRTLDDEALPIAALCLGGRAFAQSDPRVLNIGGAVIKRALLRRSAASARITCGGWARRWAIFPKSPRPCCPARPGRSRSPWWRRWRCSTNSNARAAPLAKGELLQQTLARISSLEARYVIKILTGELRIGLKEGLLGKRRWRRPFGQSADAIREANMLLGDLGRVALLAREDALARAELTLFQPIKSMLASPEPTAEAIWARHEELHAAVETGAPVDQPLAWRGARRPGAASVVWVEDKFDGVRAQLHRDADGRVEIYSRDLRRVTAQFEEIAKGGVGGVAGHGHLRRRDRRLRERQAADVLRPAKAAGPPRARPVHEGEHVPIVLLVFDLLHLNGRSLLAEPLAERRRLLDGADAAHARRSAAWPWCRPRARTRSRGRSPGRAPARQRGPHHQGPGQPVHAGAARAGVAQVEEGTGHAGRGGRRRGMGSRQAQQRAQ